MLWLLRRVRYRRCDSRPGNAHRFARTDGFPLHLPLPCTNGAHDHTVPFRDGSAGMKLLGGLGRLSAGNRPSTGVARRDKFRGFLPGEFGVFRPSPCSSHGADPHSPDLCVFRAAEVRSRNPTRQAGVLSVA